MPSTKQQGLLGSLAVRNFWAEQNNSTSKPADRIKLLSVSRENASSSTTKTTGRVVKSSCFFKAAPTEGLRPDTPTLRGVLGVTAHHQARRARKGPHHRAPRRNAAATSNEGTAFEVAGNNLFG